MISDFQKWCLLVLCVFLKSFVKSRIFSFFNSNMFQIINIPIFVQLIWKIPLLIFKEIITYIFIAGVAQGLLLSLFLFRKSENKIANRLLSLTMLLFAIDLIAEIAFVTGYIKNIPILIGLNNSLPYLYGPAIYLYATILERDEKVFNKRYILHAVPFFLVQVYGVFFFYFESLEYQVALIDLSQKIPWHLQLVGSLIPVHGLTYLALTIKKVLKFNRKLKDSYSQIEKLNLNWLKYLVFGTSIIWGISFLSSALNLIYDARLFSNISIYIGLSFLLYSLGYKSLQQPEVIFLTENLSQKNIKHEVDGKQKGYQKSGLNKTDAEQYLKSLLTFMEDEKPYLNDELNLSELAKLLNLSTHNLSEIINTKLNLNFYEFINKYRVEEVKKLIVDEKCKNYSILAIGYEAGFSSKSVFYSAFKKFVGVTPTQFRSTNKPN